MKLRFCLTDKFIAGFIALTLCLSIHPPELKAQTAASVPGSVPSVKVMHVSIPEEIGTLKEKFEGRDGRMVFILQDAHAIPDAQRNIQKIIDYVQREYGVELIGLEGTALPLDTLLLRSFPDQARLREVFEDYFQRGELTGGSAAALFNDAPALYHGIEDWNLYEDGLGLFLQATELESSMAPEIQRLFSLLEIEKKKIYSPELLLVDRAIENYHGNKGDLSGLLETLAAIQAPEPGSETALLMEEMKTPEKNNAALEREVRQAAEDIRSVLSERQASKGVREDLALFNQRFQEFQNSSIAPEALALHLKELAFKYQIQTQVSKPLGRRIEAQKRMRDLEGTKLFDQIENYARSVKSSLFKNNQERALDTLGREYNLIRKLACLELSRAEWLELKGLLSRSEAWPITRDGVNGTEDALKLLSKMTPNIEFYKNTEKRDAALLANTEALMLAREKHSALLVAGGFHADALTYQLKAKGISYALVMPAISSLPEENSYREHMAGNVSWSRYFEARNGRVNLYDAFVRGARDALLDGMPGERGRVLKLWRDSVIRSLSGQNRIGEAAEYTRFIDETADLSSAVVLENWKRGVDNFTQGLKRLRSANQLTEESIAGLFAPAMIPAAADISLARSELRMELLPAVLSQLGVSSGLKTDAPAVTVLQDHGKKIQLLVTQGIARYVRENSRVLEMGIGSGVMTKILMESAENTAGVRFLGLDINPEAVTSAREMLETAQTALRIKNSFEVRLSDLFSAVKNDEIFDVIFWNPPWSSEASEGGLSLAKNDPGFLTLRRFLREAGNFLAPQGKIFLILPPESMEEIWEDAELLYEISPVPMFERTERRRIGLYTLTARSELRAAAGLEYDLDEETLNQDFWNWFNAELPERKRERGIFEKIVTGDDAILRGLLKDYPEKVYVKEVLRSAGTENWELSEHDGRTVYLKLSESFNGLDMLRLKGVRPRTDEQGDFLGYHEGGRGFVPVEAVPEGPGKLKFSLREAGYKVFGGAGERSVHHEREVIQDLSLSVSLGRNVDEALAVGIYRGAGFHGAKLGFAVIGMRGADRRIRPSVVMDDDSEDEDARKLVLSVSDYETHQTTPLSSEAAARFAFAQGRLMRLYHDAGLYHGYPHFENFGLVPGADFNDLKMEDLIIRDLGSTVRLKDIPASDEKTRRETAAMYRWMDLAKSIRYFRRHDRQDKYYELQLEFLKGYTGSKAEARALYEPMRQFSFDLALQYHYSEKHYVGEKEKLLDFSLPQYAASLSALYEKTKHLEAEAETARRAAEGDVRSSRRQAEMARPDIEAAPAVLAQYDIGKILSIGPTGGGVGEHGKSLLITTDQGRYVLKPLTAALYPELADGARFEVSSVRELVRQGLPAADLVRTQKAAGDFEEDRFFVEAANGKIYLLYRLSEGSTVSVDALTPGQRASSIQLLAAMHKALSGFEPIGSRTRPSIFDFSQTVEKFKQLEEALLKRQRETPGYFSTRAERFFLEYADFILEQISLFNLNLPPPLIAELPVTLVHGDFHPLNMTYEGNTVRGLFDWDHLRRDVRADDLFHGIFDLKEETQTFNLAGMKEAALLYDRFQPLQDAEFRALPELARRQLLEYLSWIVRPEKLAERHLYDLSAVSPEEQGLAVLDRNDLVYGWFLSNIRVLKDLDAKIKSGEFARAVTRSELRAGEELIQDWNEKHYFRQPGKPDDEPGHLGVQFRDTNMETGPGSIYEFDFLKEAARVFLADRDLGLSAEKFASRKEVEKILQTLSSAGVIEESLVTATMETVSVLESAAGKYHSDSKLTGLTDRGEFFQGYYRAASSSFRMVPVLVEAMARIARPAAFSTVHELEDGLEVQSADALHFTLENGFQFAAREQIGLPEGKDALTYFREEPSRVIAVYLRSVEFELPLSHEIRLALVRFQQQFQAWLDQQRNLDEPDESFRRTGAHFLKIMGSQQSVMGVLWEMYRIGILEALVPEMRRVRDIPSNFNVHAFTVGQHTMYNLKKFEDLRVTEDPQLREGRAIAAGLTAAGLRQIRLTLLFHDLGKRMVKTPVEPDHAIVSSRDIVPVRFKELGVSGEDTANAAWAVRDHMVLNAFARMQDVRFDVKIPVLMKTFGLDPEASLERLKLLYLISLTDRDSVNPWSPFMGPEILDRLNFIYQTLEDYLKTSEKDRPRHIRDMEIEAHDRTYLEWLDYKERSGQSLRGILAQMSVPVIRGYFRNVPVVDDGQFEIVRQSLIERARTAAADEGAFDRLMERLFSAFPMDQIRDYSEDEAVQRLLFLLHLDYQRDTGNPAPVVYFNPQLSRTYERGYEIVVGSPEDRDGFFEKTTGVLLRHRFDIEEADIRTLTSVEVIDTFQGFFQDDYPDEGAHIRLQDQLTRDLRDVFNGTLPSVKSLFERDGKLYRSERTLGPIATEVQFLEDADIYGTRASVFNLKTANRLGLLHALSLALNQRGINLVAAPVSTHPSMVNDTFYVNRHDKVLGAEEKEQLSSVVQSLFSEASIDLSGIRSELRTSHLDLLWPDGVTDKAFADETFRAWKSDWLAADTLAAGLKAWMIGDSLTFEFTGQDEKPVNKGNFRVSLTIRQNDAGKIIAIESKGYPGIDSREMLRGVLSWMKARGVDYVQMDVTYPEFLEALRDEWNRTRAAGPDPFVLPVRPAGNGTRMYFYLNLLNLEPLPARSELRSAEESKLFQVFGPQEGFRIQYQARWFAGIFSKLSGENKKNFLYPNLLMVLLGVKPLYYAVEDDAPDPAALIQSINAREILAGSRLVFYADESHFAALLPAAVKILSNRDWLVQKKVLGSSDRFALDLMDSALRSGDTGTLFSKTHELLMKVRSEISSGSLENMEKAHWFYGLLFGYSQEDMESYARVLKTGQKPFLDDPRYVHGRYHKVSLFSDKPAPVWITRADAALDYAFSLLEGQPGFEAAAAAYRPLPGPDSRRSELRSGADLERERLERLSGQDWKSITLEHLEILIPRAREKGREDLASAGEAHVLRMTGNLDRPMVRTDGNDFVGRHSDFFDLSEPRRKRIVLEQLARMTSALPGALFTEEAVAESRRLFTKLHDSETAADILDAEAFLAANLYSRSSVRSELRAGDDESQAPRRVTTETLGAQNPKGERFLKNRSFEGVLWIWAGQFAYRVEPDLLTRKFTFQRYSADRQTPQGSVHSVPFDHDYIVGRGSGAVQGQYVLATETDNRLSRRHFKLRVSESVWATFFSLEDAGPEGQGSLLGTRAEWTQGDVVLDRGFNLYSPPILRQLKAKLEKLGIKESIPAKGTLLPGEFSDGFYPLPAEIQARVIQAMHDYAQQGYNLTDYLLDRNLNSMVSDALSLEKDLPRIVYHPGIGTSVSNDGQGFAVLRTLIQTDFKTLVAADPNPYSLEDFKAALERQLAGIAENITVRRDSRGAYLAFFTFNGTTREIIAYYGFDASLKNPEEIKKGYQVLINRRHPYRPFTLKAKAWAALNSRKPLVLDEAIRQLDPVSGFIISDGEDEILNTDVPEPGLVGIDSLETLKRLPSLNSFVFISSFEYLELVYEKYRAAVSPKRNMPVLLGRGTMALDSFRKKIAAARQKKDSEERFSLFSALRGGPDYAGHGSGSLWASEQILGSGQLIHRKGFIQYALMNRSTMRFPGDAESGGSSYDSEGTGLFVIADDFEDGVDSVVSFDENNLPVNTISLDHPKFLAAIFGAHYVPGLKRKYPQHQAKIMSYGQAAVYLPRLADEKRKPDNESPARRSELRQASETLLDALRPGASEDLKRRAAQSVYKAVQVDPDLFLQLVRDVFQEKIILAESRKDGNLQREDGVLALQAAMDLAKKLLAPKGAAKDASVASRKVTVAVHFSKTEDPVSFIQAMIQAVMEGHLSAEVLSDAGTHKAFSRQLTEQLREFFQLKKLESSDLQKGTTASVDGLGIATAMDAAEGAAQMSEMFQGLFFDFEDIGEDSDLRLSGQILFAALLIKLAVLSYENKDLPAAGRAAFLKAELIRAVQEAGYVRVSQDSFQTLGNSLIRIAGGSLIGSLIDEMKARTQIGRSA